MIRDQLSPIDLQAHVSQEEIAQALAFSCLSYYTTGDLGERSPLSFRRAWGDHDLIRTPATNPIVGINSPGWIAAIWNSGDTVRVLIAVHGLTSTSQLTRTTVVQGFLSWPFTMVSYTGRPGFSLAQYRNQAQEMWAAISAHPSIAPILALPRCVVTFTGHSFGAAISEIMASELKQNEPHRRVRLIKFASPRIGTVDWRPFHGTATPTANVICGRDPIHCFPFQAINLELGWHVFTDPVATITRLQALVRDPNVIRVRRNAPNWSHGYGTDGNGIDGVRAIASLINSVDEVNIWFDHCVWSYRLAMMQYCASVRDAMELRFNYLEMPNETQWQFSFNPGRSDWRNWFINAPVASDPHAPASVVQEEEGGGGGQDYGHTPPQSVMQPVSDEAGGGGQAWGGMRSSITTSSLPRRRRRF